MSCTAEKNRSDDKFTAWRVAHADLTGAGIIVIAAEASVIAACPFFWTGLGTAACAAALAALATASANFTSHALKTDAAMDAYHDAFKDYQECMAKCKRK